MSTSPSPSAGRPAKSGGVVIPHRAVWHQRLLALVIFALVRTIAATLRYRLDDHSGYFSGALKEQMIFALWHNRLALSATLYRRYVWRHLHKRRIAGMVSASRDGGLLAEIFGRFGIEPVRGSSSRRGPQALREMVSRPARSVLLGAGRCGRHRATDGPDHRAGVLPAQLENSVEKLGPVSGSAALCLLSDHRGPALPCAAGNHRCRA